MSPKKKLKVEIDNKIISVRNKELRVRPSQEYHSIQIDEETSWPASKMRRVEILHV